MSGMTRRTLLRGAGATAVTLGLAPAPLRAAGRQTVDKTVPASGERLFPVGMGTARTFDANGDAALEARLTEVLQAFFDHGGQLIDSSPMYGSSEATLGRLLARTSGTDALFAATKVWSHGREAGIAQMQASREKWGVERFDLMQIHNLRDWRTHLATLRDWKAGGRIGITTSHGRDHDEFSRIMRTEELDFVQFSYSLGNRDAERALLPIAADRGIATLINRPFRRGSLFARVKGRPLPGWAADIDCQTWAQVFLKYALSHPAATCVIPATSQVKHMTDNMGAGRGDVVMISSDGKFVREMMNSNNTPVRWAVIGLQD